MENQDSSETSADFVLESPMPESINKEANKMEGAWLGEDLSKTTKDDPDVKETTSLPENVYFQLFEKTENISLDDGRQSLRNHTTNSRLQYDNTCNYFSILKTDEKKVEGLEETNKLITLKDERNDIINCENCREQENINKEPPKEVKTLLNNMEILLVNDSKVTTKSEEDVSGETNGTFPRVCFCTGNLSLLDEGLTVKLEGCRHIICSGCMTVLLKEIIADTTVEPRCPHINDGIRCNSLIQEYEILELVEPNLFEEYLEKCIKKVKEDAGGNILHCQTPTCEAWYIKEDNYVEKFVCTLCKVTNYVNIKDNKKPGEDITENDEYIKNERYNEFLLLSKSDIVPNFESFECPICFVEYEPQKGLILKNCLHTFCKACMVNVILHSEDTDIKCPYKNDVYSCDEIISQSEIRGVLKPDDFQKYLQKSIAEVERKAGKSAFHCKTPNCPDWCFYELGVEHFLCPTCNEDNCFLCDKIHTGRGCADDISSESPETMSKKSKELIEIMLRNGTALLCPTCDTVITKADGCDSIKCPACKTEICWVTRGPRWGPRGHGDTSGGCKCKPFARCHPNCRNCH